MKPVERISIKVPFLATWKQEGQVDLDRFGLVLFLSVVAASAVAAAAAHIVRQLRTMQK